MSEMTVFAFESAAVRVRVIGGEPWFVASDVCSALTIGNSRMALDRLDEDEKGVSSIDTLGGPQEMSIVNESGLYSLILGSRKPEAKRFKKWVTSEVLPSLRKTGRYEMPGAQTPHFSTGNPAHLADITVGASRIFNAMMRAGRSLRIPLSENIRRAAEITRERTGIDILADLGAEDYVDNLASQEIYQCATDVSDMPILEFLKAWLLGETPLPSLACQSLDFCKAYEHWAKLNGKYLPGAVKILETAALYPGMKKSRIRIYREKNRMVSVLITPKCQERGRVSQAWLADQVFAFKDALFRWERDSRPTVFQ